MNQNYSPVSTAPKRDGKRFRRSKTFSGIAADKQEPTFSPIPKFTEVSATSSPLPAPQIESELERLIAKYNLSPIKPVETIQSQIKSPEKSKPAKKTKQLKLTQLSTVTTSSTQPSRALQRHKSASTLRSVARIEEEIEDEEDIQINVADLENISDYEIVLLVDTAETTGG